MMGIPTEDTPMESNGAVRVNWFNVNVPTILAVAGVGWGIATYINDMQNSIDEIERFRIARTQSTDGKFDKITAKLDTLDDLPTRMATVEAQILATNLRLDRLVENLTGSVEALRKDVNTVGTKVEVLGSKIDGLTPAAQRRAEGWTPPRIVK